jgi:hypothetical protein
MLIANEFSSSRLKIRQYPALRCDQRRHDPFRCQGLWPMAA